MLGFDPYKVLTFRDKDVRKVVALEKAKEATEEAVSYTHLDVYKRQILQYANLLV